jgi:hypothetical protein
MGLEDAAAVRALWRRQRALDLAREAMPLPRYRSPLQNRSIRSRPFWMLAMLVA